MAISVVNGYLCLNSCDAAKARAGQDPNASTDGSKSNAFTQGAGQSNSNGASNSPATVFGGSLSGSGSNGSSAGRSGSQGNAQPIISVDVWA
jgi:hypothetical protein